MAVTLPSFVENLAHPTWDHSITANIPQLMRGVVEFGKYAKPTAKIMWETKQYIEVDTDKKFRINWSYGGGDIHYGTPGTMTFNTETKDFLSTMHASPAVLYGATSVSDFDRKVYSNSMHDLVADRTFRMNQGFTDAMNYETWAKTGSVASEGTGTEIDIDSIFTHGINEVKIKNRPAIASRVHSIPYFIRPHVNGHTIQGLNSTDQSFWRSNVYIAKGLASSTGGDPTILNSANNSGSNAAASSADGVSAGQWVITDSSDLSRQDMLVTDGAGDGSQNDANVFPSLSDIDFMLEKMQEGNAYQILVACPPAAYNYIARDFFGTTLGNISGSAGQEVLSGQARAMDTQNPLTDYGINFTGSAFRHSGYDAIFYSDPTLSTAWPNSLWFFDMDALFTACVNDFSPKIYPWHHLPNTTVDVMAKLLWMQRVVVDRKATGVLLGCKWR